MTGLERRFRERDSRLNARWHRIRIRCLRRDGSGEHLQVTKSRCPKLSGGVFPKLGRELGDMLKEWLGSGVAPDQAPKPNNETPIPPAEPSKNGRVNGIGGLLVAPAIPRACFDLEADVYSTRRGEEIRGP